ncbi:MAG: hypothetical protein KJ626_16730, partial [Verrucomicrobia bacterium]|nr:hypothetical protein [Verrucomicrobiota bacterium]
GDWVSIAYAELLTDSSTNCIFSEHGRAGSSNRDRVYGGFICSPHHEKAWLRLQGTVNVNDREIPFTRVFRPPVIDPLWIREPRALVVSVSSNAYVVTEILNASANMQKIEIACRGDFKGERIQGEIAPGESRCFVLKVTSGQPGEGSMNTTVESNGKKVSDRDLTVVFLKKGASLARDSRIQVEVDNSYGGYNTEALNDGVVNIKGVPWNKAAWASGESGGPHWVRLQFPEPVEIGGCVLHWNMEGGITYTSRRGEIRVTTPDGEVVRTSVSNDKPEPMTTVSFNPTAATRIEFYQQPGGGSEKRPNLIWLREIEVH